MGRGRGISSIRLEGDGETLEKRWITGPETRCKHCSLFVSVFLCESEPKIYLLNLAITRTLTLLSASMQKKVTYISACFVS